MIYGNNTHACSTNRSDEWKKSGNKKVLQRIRTLIESIQKTPFEGIGKPEPLKYELTGKWSRWITNADRLI